MYCLLKCYYCFFNKRIKLNFRALDKKFESFRSKVSTSDILAIPDPESMQLDPDDIECANENSEKSTKKEIEKSVTKTPTRQEGRVTRSRTPQGKKAKNNAGKLPNTPKDKTTTPKRPVTPSQNDEIVRVTRSKTPRKTEENLTTPKRAAKQTSPKTPRYLKIMLFFTINSIFNDCL